MVSPFFSVRTADRIKQLARRGFATALAVADPAYRNLTISRRDGATGDTVPVLTGEFLVTVDNRLAQEVRAEGVEGRVISGRIQRFAPEAPAPRLAVGWVFDLPNVGPATITGTLPDEFGIEQAVWSAEGGAS